MSGLFHQKNERENPMKINADILAEQPFLNGMTARQLESLAADSMFANFEVGKRTMKEGGSSNRFHIILEGRVELELRVRLVLAFCAVSLPLRRAGGGPDQDHIFLRDASAYARFVRGEPRSRLRIDEALFCNRRQTP